MNGHGDGLFARKNGYFANLPTLGLRRIGYWMSAKKLKKMDMAKFAVICR
jgi:hypothetical protein